MKIVMNEDRAKPTNFPVCWVSQIAHTSSFLTHFQHKVRLKPGYSKYFFLGQGERTVIVWTTLGCIGGNIWLLNADKKPSERIISAFRDALDKVKWPGYNSEIDTDDEMEDDMEDWEED